MYYRAGQEGAAHTAATRHRHKSNAKLDDGLHTRHLLESTHADTHNYSNS